MPDQETSDLFYRGTIVRYAPATGQGVVRSAAGRDIVFDLQFVKLAPTFRGRNPETSIIEGLEVGFDVGWTSRGLRASRFFPIPPGSERETGEERHVTANEGSGQNEYQFDIE